jgi:hypothetical protein
MVLPATTRIVPKERNAINFLVATHQMPLWGNIDSCHPFRVIALCYFYISTIISAVPALIPKGWYDYSPDTIFLQNPKGVIFSLLKPFDLMTLSGRPRSNGVHVMVQVMPLDASSDAT